MEITIEKYRYKNLINCPELKLNGKSVIGLFGDNSKIILDLLLRKKSISDKRIKKDGKKSKIKYSIIDSRKISFKEESVRKEINYYCKKNKIVDKIFKDQIEKYINILNLPKDIIHRKISSLSSSDKYKIYILLNTIFDKDVYIFINANDYLDNNNRKCLKTLIEYIKNNDKVVVIYDEDINYLYYNTDEVLVINKGEIFIKNTYLLFTSQDYLKKEKFVPYLPLITYLANKRKKIKLSYHKDVRDIIKDIYKHV